MPYFDEHEGIWLLTPAEEKERRFGGALAHPLTQAERSKGGRSGTGQAKRRSEAFYRIQHAYRGKLSASKRWGSPSPGTFEQFAASRQGS